MKYLSLLYSYYFEIKEQQNALQDIQRRLLPPKAIPIYYLHPAINLLSELKSFFDKLIHFHKRDSMRTIRHDWLV